MEKEKHVKIVKFNTASQTMHWNVKLAMWMYSYEHSCKVSLN